MSGVYWGLAGTVGTQGQKGYRASAGIGALGEWKAVLGHQGV